MAKPGIELAIESAGSCERLASQLRSLDHLVSRQAVLGWKRKGLVPGRRVIAVERLTRIHRHYLNPVIYPDPPPPPPALPSETVAA